MFERLLIEGFQNHRRTDLSFDDFITILAGPTDSGKSAILRALRWLCLNKAPKRHIGFDAKMARVILWVDKHKITRKQSKSINSYFLDGKEYKAFNKGVPDDIQKILRVSDLNFQRQWDGPFWLSLSPSQVSRELNQIVDLGVIDSSQSKMAKMIRKESGKQELITERIAKARADKKQLAWALEINENLKEIEWLAAEIDVMQSQASGLGSLIRDIQALEAELQGRDKLIQRVDFHRESVETLQKDIDKLKTDRDRLKLLITQYKKEKVLLCQSQKRLNSLKARLRQVKRCPICQSPM